MDEQELATSFTDALFAAAPIGLGIIGADMHYLKVNQVLADINGPSVDEHVGSHISEVVPALATMLEPMLKEILASGEPIIDVEVPGPGAAPERFFSVSFYPMLMDGRPVAVIGVVLDITDRINARKDLHDQAQQVYQEVVQGLTVIQMALESGMADKATDTVRSTLDSAKRLTSKVLAERFR